MMNNDHCSSDQEAMLFHSYPSAYYVPNIDAADHLSGGYPSSRGSNNSFPKEEKMNVKEEEEWHYGNKGGVLGRYLSFGRSSSCLWFCVQIGWRVMVSLGAALCVFYIATNPPPPSISVKIARIRPFGLGEGVDSSGVSTKILSCNCSMHVVIENNSKIFGLHVAPPVIDMSFGRLPLANSHGPKVYVESEDLRMLKLSVETRKKAMYGAGRRMEDMLESGNGLPLAVRVSVKSHYRVVGKLIGTEFEQQAHCVMVLHNAYDKKHRTQAYNSTCTLTSSY